MSFPTTRRSLFSRMGHQDDRAWTEFVGQYLEPSLGFLRSLGLSKEDAEDLFQEAVLRLPERYCSGRGRFRTFWMTALRHRTVDWARKEKADKRGSGRVDSLDAPISRENDDGPGLLERLEDETILHYSQTWQEVAAAIDTMLKDYPDQKEKAIYLDWFWNHGPEAKDKDFAERHALKLNQFRYLLRKVRKYLERQAARDRRRQGIP